MGTPRAIWPLASAIASLLVMAAPSAGGVFTRSPLQTVSVASTSPCEAIGHMASCFARLCGEKGPSPPELSRVVLATAPATCRAGPSFHCPREVDGSPGWRPLASRSQEGAASSRRPRRALPRSSPNVRGPYGGVAVPMRTQSPDRAIGEGRPAPISDRTFGLQGFVDAPERIRTSTDHTVHKALNLARLPIPPQAPEGPGSIASQCPRPDRGAGLWRFRRSVIACRPEHLFASRRGMPRWTS